MLPSPSHHVLMPRGGLLCAVCDQDAGEDANIVEQRVIADGAAGRMAIAVAICPACWQRAIDQDGSPAALIGDLQSGENSPHQLPPVEPHDLILRRRELRQTKYPRKHPAGHRRALESALPIEQPLAVAVGARSAARLPGLDPLISVEPHERPEFLDLAAADGRAAIVVHGDDAAPGWLIRLAQALIDHGARKVSLRSGPTLEDAFVILPDRAHD
ncbi:MAG: hypothetical protein KDG55_08745 [Rhodocyclaceae bacterium]|nr:hypothetical protein [Rhodocyclaceae bacterium]